MDENRESGKRKGQSSRCHLFSGLVSLVTWLGRISAVVLKWGVGGAQDVCTVGIDGDLK